MKLPGPYRFYPSSITMTANPLFAVCIGCLALASAGLHAQLAISSYTVDGGGGRSSGGSFTLAGTIGQPDASEPLVVDPFGLTGGFWADAALVALTGYPAWAVENIAPGLDASFHGDADGDGLANGLQYVLGSGGIEALGAGLMTAPPAAVPSDVRLILDFSDDLLSWSLALEYVGGVQTFTHPDFSIINHVVIHNTTEPRTFYRYGVELLP